MMDFVNDIHYYRDQRVIEKHFEIDIKRFDAQRPLNNCAMS